MGNVNKNADSPPFIACRIVFTSVYSDIKKTYVYFQDILIGFIINFFLNASLLNDLVEDSYILLTIFTFN